jgi:hypothetical protein
MGAEARDDPKTARSVAFMDESVCREKLSTSLMSRKAPQANIGKQQIERI